MYIGKVVGTVVSTSKDPRLTGSKLLIVLPMGFHTTTFNYPVVAVDTVGAGIGETVLYVKGSVARRSVTEKDAPIDCAIVGIIDELKTAGDLLEANKLSLVDGDVLP